MDLLKFEPLDVLYNLTLNLVYLSKLNRLKYDAGQTITIRTNKPVPQGGSTFDDVL